MVVVSLSLSLSLSLAVGSRREAGEGPAQRMAGYSTRCVNKAVGQMVELCASPAAKHAGRVPKRNCGQYRYFGTWAAHRVDQARN